jgi:hypothetical protein
MGRMLAVYVAIGAIMALGVAWDLSHRDSTSMQAGIGQEITTTRGIQVSNAR